MKVGVKVREEPRARSQAVLGGEREVLVDVALRVDDRSDVRVFVADQIGRMRQAIEIELFQDHRFIMR